MIGRAVLRQSSLDLPHQFLAPLLVGLGRLLIDQFVHVRVAITVIVQLTAAALIQVEVLVGVQREKGRLRPPGPFAGLSWRVSTLERIPPIRSTTSCRSDAPRTRNLPSVIGLWFRVRATGSSDTDAAHALPR
jgi:hypothetical protein